MSEQGDFVDRSVGASRGAEVWAELVASGRAVGEQVTSRRSGVPWRKDIPRERSDRIFNEELNPMALHYQRRVFRNHRFLLKFRGYTLRAFQHWLQGYGVTSSVFMDGHKETHKEISDIRMLLAVSFFWGIRLEILLQYDLSTFDPSVLSEMLAGTHHGAPATAPRPFSL